MIDRQARDELIDAIKAYLGRAGLCVKPLNVISKCCQSKDKTVAVIAQELDEFLENAALTSEVTAKESWDCTQRLLLLLASECELEKNSVRFWGLWQIPAIVFISLVVYLFFSGQIELLLILLIPVWPTAEACLFFMRKSMRAKTKGIFNFCSYPFKDRKQIRRVYAKTKGFHKTNFGEEGARKTGVARVIFAYFVYTYIILGRIIYTPIGLIIQMLPINFTWYEVKERLGYE